MTLRVVHYYRRLLSEVGGVASAVIDLSDTLAGAGASVTVMTQEPGVVAEGLHFPSRAELVILGSRRTTAGILWRPHLTRARAILVRSDVLHLHEVWDPGAAQLARLAERLGVPYVVNPHGSLDTWPMSQRAVKKRTYLAVVVRRLLARARWVLCTSAPEAEEVQLRSGAKNILVLPPIMRLAEFSDSTSPRRRRDDNRSTETRRVLFLGRLHPKKRPDLVLDAVAVLQARGQEAAAVLAGPGEVTYVRRLVAHARTLGIANRVTFPGLVRGEARRDLFASADVLVLPSQHENWGIVVFESLAAGVPVVTTKGVATWRELEATGAARVVEPSPEAIADGIASILADPTISDRLETARSAVLHDHDPHRVVGRYLEAYRSH